MTLLAIFKVDVENLTVNATLIAMASVVGLAVLLNCRTWWQVTDSVLHSQRRRLHNAANSMHKLKSEGFMKVRWSVDSYIQYSVFWNVTQSSGWGLVSFVMAVCHPRKIFNLLCNIYLWCVMQRPLPQWNLSSPILYCTKLEILYIVTYNTDSIILLIILFPLFCQVLKCEVELMAKMAKTIDGFTQNQTRLVVIIDGLDSCEQDKVLQMLDTVCACGLRYLAWPYVKPP